MATIRRYSLADVLAGNKTLFNVNNLGTPPSDYDTVSKACDTGNWIDLFHKDKYLVIELKPVDVKWILEAFEIGCITGSFPKTFADELEETCKPFPDFDQGYFVRTDRCSLKYGCHGPGPYSSMRSIIESITTSTYTHAPLKAGCSNKIYLMPWLNLDSSREFRAFVCNNTITAVSTQHLYTVNNWLNELTDAEIQALILDLDSYFRAHICAKMGWLGSYVMDIYYIGPNSWYFIEPNPFGACYSSGSALFHWETDHEVLTKPGTIELRYTSQE